MSQSTFSEFMNIIRTLRGEKGCPWDREQTHESLKKSLMEECYETVEAINNKDQANLCEELGDILLQVAMHSVIAEEQNEFTVQDVIAGVSEKMVRRHPHVFGEEQVGNSNDVLRNWEEIKKKEKNNISATDDMKSIPKAFPSIIRAEKAQKKAAHAGMDFEDVQQVMSKVYEELKELEEAMESGEKDRIDEEFGDTLFTMINLSRFLGINAENSLTNSTNKFINRFVDILARVQKEGQNLCDLTPAEQDRLWREVK